MLRVAAAVLLLGICGCVKSERQQVNSTLDANDFVVCARFFDGNRVYRVTLYNNRVATCGWEKDEFFALTRFTDGEFDAIAGAANEMLQGDYHGRVFAFRMKTELVIRKRNSLLVTVITEASDDEKRTPEPLLVCLTGMSGRFPW